MKVDEKSIISVEKFEEEFPKTLELLKQGNTGPYLFNFENLVATVSAKYQKAEKEAKERAEKEAKELAEKAKKEAEKAAKESIENAKKEAEKAKKEAEKAAKEAIENAKKEAKEKAAKDAAENVKEGWFSKTFGSIFGGDKKKEEHPAEPTTEATPVNHDPSHVVEQPKVEAKVEAHVEPTVEHKVEAHVEAKVEPTVEHKVEAKVEPTVEHKVADKKPEATHAH